MARDGDHLGDRAHDHPDPRVDDWTDDGPEPGDGDEVEALTADIATIVAGRAVVPAAIMWWRTRHERRAQRNVTSPRTRPSRWFEI